MHDAVFNVVDEYKEEDGAKDCALRNTAYDCSKDGEMTVNNDGLFPVWQEGFDPFYDFGMDAIKC